MRHSNTSSSRCPARRSSSNRLGLPPALADLTFGAEVIGGLLILAGVYTRWVAAALIPILLGATWAHSANGWVFTAANGGWEYPAFLAVAALAQALLGDGAYALVNRPPAHKLPDEAYA
jgi:putative oxidoreductase